MDISGTAPAAKVLSYLTRENGRGYLNLLYKEMVYDTDNDTVLARTSAGSHTYDQGGIYIFQDLDNPTFNGMAIQYTGSQISGVLGTGLFDDETLGEDNQIIVNATGAVLVGWQIWDGNGWGDNNKFTVLDNETTETDDNGNTIIVGQKRIELLNFIGDAE